MVPFKFRGGLNALSRLSNDERRAASSRFVGQTRAGHRPRGQLLDIRGLIVIPSDAPGGVEANRNRRLRGEVVITIGTTRIASHWRRLADERGLTDSALRIYQHIIAGHGGTAARELFEESRGASTISTCPCARRREALGVSIAAPRCAPWPHRRRRAGRGRRATRSFRTRRLQTVHHRTRWRRRQHALARDADSSARCCSTSAT